MDEKAYGQLKSAIKSYIYSTTFSNGKRLKQLLLLAPPQTRYGLFMSMRRDGLSAVHIAAAQEDSVLHTELLGCMLDGMTPLQKYNLLELQISPYRNNPLHLLVKNKSEYIINMVKYLLDGLDVQQRQKLILMKNAAGDTVINRAYRRCTSSALSNILLQATTNEVPATRAAPVAALDQQPCRVNPSNNYMNILQGNERMTHGAEAPPSYTDVMLDLPTSQDFVNPVKRTHNSMYNRTTHSVEASGSKDQRISDLETRCNELQDRCNELQDRCERLVREKNEEIRDLTTKLIAAEDKLPNMNQLGADV